MLRIDACVHVNSEALAEQVANELGRLRSRPRATAGAVMLHLSCKGNLNVLSAYHPVSGQTLLRSLDVHLHPDGIRERFLAIAAAELLAASASEEGDSAKVPPAPESDSVATDSAPPPAAPLPPVVPESVPASVERAAPAPKPPALQLVALASAQVFFSGPIALFGGGAGVGWDGLRHFDLSADLLARHGTTTLESGTVSVDTVSLSTAAYFTHAWSRLRLRIGANLSGGLVRLRGEPVDPARTEGATFLGGWLGSAFAVGTTIRLGRRAALDLTTEVGYVLLPVIGQTAGSPSGVGIAGPFWGLQLGLGLFP